LVAFMADQVLVWELTKEQFMALGGDVVSDGHVTGDADGALKEVKVRKNSRTDTVATLAPYLVATIDASDVTLV